MAGMEETYNMAKRGSRWGTMIKVLGNKKALDDAFRQHTWNMQQDAANNQSAMDRTKVQGTFGLAEKRMGINAANTPEGKAQAAVIQYATKNGLDFNDPNDQPAIQAAYQFFLTGKMPVAAEGMAAGGTPAPVQGGGFNFFNPSSWGGGGRAPAAPAANRAPGSAAQAGVQSAINPKTGERLYLRNGAWVSK